jgi:hypothetical protein
MLRPKHVTQKPPIDALPLDQCLAKTHKTYDGRIVAGRNILEHSLITGEVAKCLINLYPSVLREK